MTTEPDKRDETAEAAPSPSATTTTTTDEPTTPEAAPEPTPDTSRRDKRDGSPMQSPPSSGSSSSSRKATGTRKQRKPRKRTKATTAGASGKSLQRPLEELVSQLGAAVSIFDPFDGLVITHNAKRVAVALDELARENPALRAGLERLLGTAGWGQIVAVVGAIALPIAAHHNLLPGGVRELALLGAPAEARKLDRDARDGGGTGGIADLLGALDGLDLSAMMGDQPTSPPPAPAGRPSGPVTVTDKVGRE